MIETKPSRVMDTVFERCLGDDTQTDSLVKDGQLGPATQSRPEECRDFNRAVGTGPFVDHV